MKTTKDFKASFIVGSDDYLSVTEELAPHTLPMKYWISTRVSRQHIRYNHTITREVAVAKLEIQSDNPFDLYVNGHQLPEKEDANGWHLTGLLDITALLNEGENQFAIRGFTSDEPMRTISALRGCIRIAYTDETSEDIFLDENWKDGWVCSFFEGTEPENWQTNPIPSKYKSVIVNTLHPRQLRRSLYFRKAFFTDNDIASATLYTSGRGDYVPYINGQRVTDGRFLSGIMLGYTEYQAYDVTRLLNGKGENVLAALTGNGHYNCSSWCGVKYNKNAVLMQLEITYADGSTDIIITDRTWQVTASPLIDNDIQFGERYDARREIDGWNTAGAVSGNWAAAEEITYPEQKPFALQTYAPIRIKNENKAVAMGKTCYGEVLYDFGTNSSGRAKLCLKNTKSGEAVLIRYCEMLEENNTPVLDLYNDVFYVKDNYPDGRSPYGGRNLDVYICKGAEEEIYIPEFSYTGFRYIYITGYSGEYDENTVLKAEMHTDLKETGDLVTSNPDIAKIWDAVKRSFRSNIFNGPTDCPTREKNYWNGDIADFCNTACWYMDCNALLSRWTEAGEKMHYDCYGWEDEEYILPLTLYRYYGNKEILEIKYPVIQALIEKREQEKGEMALPVGPSPYNDHQAIENVPSDYFSAVYFCRMYKETAQIARILGKNEDAAAYEYKFAEACKAFNSKYYLADEHTYSPRNQSSVVLPLAFGLTEESAVPKLTATLNQYVTESGYHLTCGFSSVEFVLGLLCDGGYEETAWRTITEKTHPSLLYMLTTHTGGTTTEGWYGYNPNNKGDSMNHYAIGGIARWFFNYLGGIKDTAAGFETFLISPVFVKEMGDCRVNYKSVNGDIISHWTYDGNAFNWTVTVPKGTTATLCLRNGFSFADSEQTEKILTGGVYVLKVNSI